MSLLVASLYLLCLAFLFGAALYVYSRAPLARLNASFALLTLTLLGWVGTLFLYTSEPKGPGLLWLGRANFAVVALVAPATYGFVLALARKPLPYATWIYSETALLALVTLLTGGVDRAESIRAGTPMSAYGPLFPLYLLHIALFVGAGVLLALRPARPLPPPVRIQMRLVGVGILLTALVSFTTNAALPYLYGDFRFIHVGTLSTIVFLGSITYAACFQGLFNLRLLVRGTVVNALLIAFALELYQATVEALARRLPLGDAGQRHVAAATIALILNAVTQQPLRWWLEGLADRLMRGWREREQQKARRGSRAGSLPL